MTITVVSLFTVEYYDDHRRAWYPTVGMMLGRSNFSCVVMDNKIYAIGGYDGEFNTNVSRSCHNMNIKHCLPVAAQTIEHRTLTVE